MEDHDRNSRTDSGRGNPTSDDSSREGSPRSGEATGTFDARSVSVRTARDDETLDVRRILDAAMLEPGDVEARTNEGNVLVAVETRGASGSSPAGPPGAFGSDDASDGEPPGDEPSPDRILGAIVLEPLEGEAGAHVAALAVRRRRRNRGVGTALVSAALERAGRLTARFDADVAPFYESLGFAVEPVDDRRYQGTLAAPD